MSRAVVWTAAVAGAAATAAAMLLPWSVYGKFRIRLEELPGWGFYVTAAVALNVFVGWALLHWAGNQRLLVLAGTTLEAVIPRSWPWTSGSRSTLPLCAVVQRKQAAGGEGVSEHRDS